MRMAEAATRPCMLVGDIDRGGVFAALLGTVELLDPLSSPAFAALSSISFAAIFSLLEPASE